MLMGTGCNGTSNERKGDTVGRSDALDKRREDREVCDRCRVEQKWTSTMCFIL